MNKYLKIIGERNSGTNYLEALIRNNYDVHILNGSMPKALNLFLGYERVRDMYFSIMEYRNLGWKHAMAPSKELIQNSRTLRDISFIAIAKDPYSWLLSMYRRPYHQKENVLSFDDFIVQPWSSVGRERHKEPFDNPVVMWNTKNHSYIQLANYANAIVISYESILQNTFEVLSSPQQMIP